MDTRFRILSSIVLFLYIVGPINAYAQTFVEQTGASNPFNGFDVGRNSKPAFVDIDNDGDFDAFIGEEDGVINYYENTGSASSPSFTERTGGSNPLNGEDIGTKSTLAFADIDNDSDFDLFVGANDGTFYYYENTGSVSSPIFTARTGFFDNPMDSEDVGDNSTPAFIDINNDATHDIFSGEDAGTFNYYENVGLVSNPSFFDLTGFTGFDPFDGVDAGLGSTITFVDIDGDSDFDAFMGESDGSILYYENTGSAAAATFTQRTGVNNPFDGEDVGDASAPTFVDIDNDGDFDAFIGEEDGTINYYENQTAVTPSPGGVSGNLELWLKADAGVTESSGSVSAWADQGNGGNDASQANSFFWPTYTANAHNYNPGITFADEYFDTSLNIDASVMPDLTVFSVYKPGNSSAGPIWGNNNSSVNNRYLMNSSSIYFNTVGGYGSSISNLFVSGQTTLTTVVYDEDASSGSSVYIDGTQAVTFTSNLGGVTGGTLDIGFENYWQYYTGDIYEVVMYSNVLTDNERDRVHTYLGLKYGIGLSHDYLASDGTTIWDVSANSSYSTDVAGIGRDDAHPLDQRQAISGTDNVATMALGSLATDNASNSNAFSADRSFLIWGHNGGTSSFSVSYSGTNTNVHMGRVWLVKETGTVGTVEVNIADNYSASHLIVGSDAAMSSATEYALADNGDGTASASVNFTDGQYFTFGTSGGAPGGGVSGDLELWLKADAGTTLSGSNVRTWADQGNGGNDASQANSFFWPTYTANAHNYNPGITFADEYFDTSLNIDASVMPDLTVFSVYKPGNSSAGPIWGNNNSSVNNRYLMNSSSIYFNTVGGYGSSISNLFVSGQTTLTTVVYDEDASSGSSVYIDGTQAVTFTSNLGGVTGGTLDIGFENYWQYYTGDIYEVVMYSNVLTDNERDRVHTYLGLKYGIGLSHDYLASDGTTIWDVSANSSYSTDVAGIGRDDAHPLDQRQAISGTDNVATMALGSLATDNASNSNAFSADRSFLIWGHNGGTSSFSVSYSGTNTNVHMGRVWLVKETGTVGTVEVNIADNYSASHLIVGSDAAMSSATEYALADNGDGTASASVNFTDGQYFTFGTSGGAPGGGVSGDLELWLKADAGTTLSGSNVRTWADQGNGGNDASQANSFFWPTYTANAHNYNPGITFADEYFDTSLNIDASVMPDLTVFSVYKPGNSSAGPIWGNNNSSVNNRYLMNSSSIYFNTVGGYGSSISNLFVSGQTTLTTVVYDEDASSGSSVYIDGTQAVTFTSNLGGVTGGTLDIGFENYWQYYTGDIYEVVMYSNVLTDNERDRVHTYLGLKYGIGLSHDYLASDGTTIWNVSANSSYSTDVAGIGRDDAHPLDQRQAQSSIVSIGRIAIAADNASNSNNFCSDLSFLIWGHNDDDLEESSTTVGGNSVELLDRIWLLAETVDSDSLQIQFDLSTATVTGTTASDFWLVLDTDTDPSNGTRVVVQANSFTSNIATFTNIDVSDGDYMMLVTDNPSSAALANGTASDDGSPGGCAVSVTEAPGGVTGDLALWLKADAGVSLSGGNVTTWNDQSGNGNHATTGGGAVTQNTAALNYNPSLDWDNTSDYLSGTSDLGLDNDNTLSMFFVLIDNGSNDYSEVFALSTYDDEHRLEDTATFGSWAFYDNSFTSNLFVYASSTPTDRTSWAIVSGIYTGTQYSAYLNGTLGISRSFAQGIDTDAGSTYSIGFAHNGSIHGSAIFELTELVVYSSDVSSTQSQIESYLALKYGIHLSGNYVASDATTLWNATTNATYHNDVAGIGRDDASALNQKQSDSGILSVALGSLAADNASNSNTFSSDLSFLLLGHNNGSLTETTTTISSNSTRLLSRIWLAEETSESGALEVRIDLSGATVTGTTAADFQLVLDTNTDPSDGYRAITTASSFSSNIATFSSVDIQDGDYLMLATYTVTGSTDPPLTDSQAADGVIGQADFDSRGANTSGVSAATFNGPTSVATGPTGKVFISDTKNNRILRWSSANAIVDGSSAEAVLGQADFTSTSANRGGSVAANTLYEPMGIYVTASGALYVADTFNNRVLRFDNAESAADGADADAVLGQADFTSNNPNRRRNVAANSLRHPRDVYVDGSGALWVADYLNHRVLRYDNVAAKADGADSDGVLGQESFTTNLRVWKDGNTDADSFVYPSGVYVASSGVLWVADAGNSRVLRFDSAAGKANGADADGVLGQDDFTSWKAHKGGQPAAGTIHWPDAGLHGDNNGRLYVADRWGDRLLWYHNAATKANGADADGLVGQPGFTTRHGLVDDDSFNSVTDVFVDTSTDYIWVVDNAHNRLLRFDASNAAIGKASTAFILSQFDLWLKAGEGAFVDPEARIYPENNQNVGVWLDQSIRRFTAVSDLPPVFVRDAINGYPAISFEGPDASMIISGGLFGETNFDRASVWTVKDVVPGVTSSFVLSVESDGTQVQYGDTEHRHIPKSSQSRTSPSEDDLILGSGITGDALAELILTFKNLSSTEQQVITSYLALKYGFTLDGPYLSSSGDTLWVDDTYMHGIAGIVRDDLLGLDHAVSSPYGDDYPLTISQTSWEGRGASADLSNVIPGSIGNVIPGSIGNVIWAHDGGALSIDQPSTVDIAPFRMGRTWKMRRTGAIDSVTVYLPGDTRADYLLLSPDASLQNPEVYAVAEGIQIPVNSDSLFITLASTQMYLESPDIPEVFALHQNYPNPFGASTTIPFDLPEDESVSLVIYDLIGREVVNVIDEELPAGRHQVAFIPERLASGVYFYALEAGGNRDVGKMIYRR